MPDRAYAARSLLSHALPTYLQLAKKCDLGGSTYLSGILNVPVQRHLSARDLQVPIVFHFGDFWIGRIPTAVFPGTYPWLKSGKDWHVLKGRICFELPERWTDHLELLASSTNEDVPDLAAQWLINSTRHIAHVHYTCYATRRTSWPKSIPFWPHEEEGRRLYEQEKSQASAFKKIIK